MSSDVLAHYTHQEQPFLKGVDNQDPHINKNYVSFSFFILAFTVTSLGNYTIPLLVVWGAIAPLTPKFHPSKMAL